jgi:hypothetical protein
MSMSLGPKTPKPRNPKFSSSPRPPPSRACSGARASSGRWRPAGCRTRGARRSTAACATLTRCAAWPQRRRRLSSWRRRRGGAWPATRSLRGWVGGGAAFCPCSAILPRFCHFAVLGGGVRGRWRALAPRGVFRRRLDLGSSCLEEAHSCQALACAVAAAGCAAMFQGSGF